MMNAPTSQTNGNRWYAAEVLTVDLDLMKGFRAGATVHCKRSDVGPGVVVFAHDTRAIAFLTRQQASDLLQLGKVALPAFQIVLNDLFEKAIARKALVMQPAPNPQTDSANGNGGNSHADDNGDLKTYHIVWFSTSDAENQTNVKAHDEAEAEANLRAAHPGAVEYVKTTTQMGKG